MPNWISQQDLLELPEDPDLAFAELEHLARERLDRKNDEAQVFNGRPNIHWELEYMSSVSAAANAFGIEALQGWTLPSASDEDQIMVCRNFRQEAIRVAFELEIRGVRRLKKYSVAFDAAAKAKLHHHLNQIRDTIAKLEITIAKKERLYERISDLELEIDRDRTRVEAYGALAMEAATNASDASRPIMEILEKIGTFFGLSKAAEEQQARLPRPKTPKRLEAPQSKKLPEQENSFERDLDEEIPF